jgi:ABC-type antimicrobial peptide transport system permease subunit
MLSYAVKRVIRSLGLFAALLLGVILASTFFAGVNIGADTTAKAALNQQLSLVPVDIVIGQYGSQTSSSTVWTAAASKVANVSGIIGAEATSRAYWYGNTAFENNTSLRIVGVSNISNVSPFYEGLTVTSGAGSLGANETYVWVGSKSVDKIELNSTISLNFTFSYWVDTYSSTEKSVSISLKVVGLVELDDKAYSIAAGEFYGSIIYRPTQEQSHPTYGDNLLIVNWKKTFPKLLDAIPSNVPYYSSPFTTQILAYIDRDALVNPWDIQGSLEAVEAITAQANQAVAMYGMSANNNLEQILMSYQSTSMTMRFSFFIVALPVFFVAWYVGTTVSDVSYNLRRREIGLLLTKGFSTGQLFRMFLTESFMIGIIGGLIGVGLGFLLSPFFATAVGGELGATPVLSQEVIVIAIIFSLAITLLSTFRPSRRASKLPPVDALREYMYVEEVKPYRQRWPWIAFSLGLYKIIMFLFGINLAQMFFGGPQPFANIFLLILFGVWIMIDSVLTYIGPLLFFWGFTKIFIHGSLKFQELVTRAARFLGDLGTLATKNVQRNPVRAASVAFLIALIVGYSFQTVGAVASEQDYITRQVKADVGADISVQLTSATNASSIANKIEDELSEVASATLEYSFSGTLPSQYYLSQIRAVDPDKWLSTAYYETEWFSGNDVAIAFQQMRTSNRTIILERNLAKSLGKKVGNNVTLTIGGSTLELEIVGFFGPEVTQQQYYIQPYEYVIGTFWSYVPIGLYESLNGSLSPSTRVLVKLKPGADGKSVALEILNFDNVNYARSVAEELETRQSNLVLSGSLNIQRIGVVFSILAASVATGLATLVSLQERKREASIMSARGLSFKQLVTMLLAENLAVVVFAAVLGIVVGLIVVLGNVAASNATLSYSLVAHRMVFPTEAIILLSTCLILVFASAIIPLILLTKRYVSKLERIVRL